MSIRIISKPFLIAATATLAASGLGAHIWHEQHRPAVLEIYVFALKSGRSMFIRTPDDRRILIDGGSNSEVIRQLTTLIPFYSRRIDTIIITNTDGKNASGLIDVIDRYVVDRIYVPKFTLEGLGLASSMDKIYETFLQTIGEKNIEVKEILAGDELILGGGTLGPGTSRTPKVTVQIIFPSTPIVFDYSKASAPELLFNISYGGTPILFMGDASKKVQKFVASSSSSIISDANILVVSHSAAAANMSAEFMDVVRPESLVYEKVVTKASAKSAPKKKAVADPLAAILDENRFNLKEIGTVKIVSDGREVVITGNN